MAITAIKFHKTIVMEFAMAAPRTPKTGINNKHKITFIKLVNRMMF
jgi:hypothetical protein